MSAAVYRHFSATGELLYIGFSAKPLDRNRTHSSQATWFKEIASITIQWHDTAEEALKAESEAIRRECPRENVVGMPDDLFRKRFITLKAPPVPPPFVSKKPHQQLDALHRMFGLSTGGWRSKNAGITVERENEIRESGRELFVSEVAGFRRSLGTTYKLLESIGLHRGNQG